MKTFAVTIAALTLSTAALADISSGNSDLSGWVVEDRSLQTTGSLQKDATSGVLFASDDTYGSVIFDRAAPSSSASPATVGVGDSYGSVLHSVGFDW